MRGEEILVSVHWEGVHRKLVKVCFGKKDGSLYICFPYYWHTEGLLSKCLFPPGQHADQILIDDEARVTLQRVKYSHHPSGRCHFSQSGLVQAVIGKQATPIDQLEGHEFTLQVHGLQDFQLTSKDEVEAFGSARRKSVSIGLGVPVEGLTLVGMWHSARYLAPRIQGAVAPVMNLINPEGQKYIGALLAPPKGWPFDNRVLVLYLRQRHPLNQSPSCLTFIGGFDPREVALDPTVSTEFLALSYPIVDAQALIETLGSADFT